MLRNTFSVFLALQSLNTVEALSLAKRDGPAVVSLDFARSYAPDLVRRDIKEKRSSTVGETIGNQETYYSINVTLGTPAQNISLLLDTGSSDLWANAANSTFCADPTNQCASLGTYDANSSSTYAYVSSDFNITYEDNTGSAGDYVNDTVSVGGATLPAFQFGVGYTSSTNMGVLGVGYPSNEAQVTNEEEPAYVNFPQALHDHGLINSVAYSLWLNDLNANTGSILFGGVDTGKYTGTLETLPIQTIGGIYQEFLVILTGVALQNSSSTNESYTSDELPVTVLLDSGNSISFLPDSVVEDIYTDLGVLYEGGCAYVPCSMANENINITYTFSGQTIPIMISELVIENGTNYFNDGSPACAFGLLPTDGNGGSASLGDTFLRSAYVVYDLSNNEISLAPTRFNSTDQNILEITNGTAAVPGATVVPHPVTTAASSAAVPWTITPTQTSIISSPPSSSSSTSTSSAAAAAMTNMVMDLSGYLALGAAGAGVLLAF